MISTMRWFAARLMALAHRLTSLKAGLGKDGLWVGPSFELFLTPPESYQHELIPGPREET
jgi:hypothetical protein